METSPFFWLLWLIIVAICLWQLFKAWQTAEYALSFPFVASGMWLYFYGYMAFKVAINGELRAYIPTWIIVFTQFINLLCLIAILLGWRQGINSAKRNEKQTPYHGVDYHRLYRAGIFLMIVAAIAIYSFRSQENIDWKNTTKYWPMLFQLGYPGLAACIIANLKLPSAGRYFRWALTATLLVACAATHLINARRGPILPFFIVMLLVPPLATGKKPRPSIVMGGLAVALIVMLFVVAARRFVYNNGTWDDAFRELTVSSVVEARTETRDDNEFVYACYYTQTVYEYSQYNYGSSYLLLPLNIIPRQLWADKPSISQGLFPWTVSIQYAVGDTLTTGASAGGVAESFGQFGVFCPIMWFLIAYGFGRFYLYAIAYQEPWPTLVYVSMMCTSHWLISQSLNEAFVPIGFYLIGSWLCLRVSRTRSPDNELATFS